MTLRKASSVQSTLQTVSLAVCRRQYALLAVRSGGGKKETIFLIILQDFLPLNTFGTCYKFRTTYKIPTGAWHHYLRSYILVSSLFMCYGSRGIGSWQLRQL